MYNSNLDSFSLTSALLIDSYAFSLALPFDCLAFGANLTQSNSLLRIFCLFDSAFSSFANLLDFCSSQEL